MTLAVWKHALGWTLLALAPAGAGCAQGPLDAALRGRVVDAHGVAVAGISLRLAPIEGGSARVVTTGSRGAFLVLRLTPGTYTLGMGAVKIGPVSLDAGEVRDVELTKGPGGTLGMKAFDQEPIHARTDGIGWQQVVSAEEDTTPATRAEEDVARGSASEGDAGMRDPSEGSLSETRFAVASAATLTSPVASIAESRQQGFPTQPLSGGVDLRGSAYAQGALRGLRLQSSDRLTQYSAQTRWPGTITLAAPGAGWHGEVFMQARASAWAATNPFSVASHYSDGVVSTSMVKPAGSVLQFGGTLGTGLAKRAALLASLDMQQRQGSIVSTPVGIAGAANFFSLTPMQVDLLGTRGVSMAATRAALNYLDSLTGAVADNATRVGGLARLDVAIGTRDAVTVSSIGHHSDAPAGAALGQASDAVVARGTGSIGASYVEVQAGEGRWLHTFSPRWNLEVRAQAVHELAYETPHAAQPQEPAIGPGGLAPQVSIAPNGFSYGTPASLGRTAYPEERRLQTSATFQVRLGSSLLTLGAEWIPRDDRIATLLNADGSFLYDSGITGGRAGGLVDWITDYTFNVNAYPNGGCPNIHAAVHLFCFRTYTQSFGPQETRFVTQEFAGFAETAVRLRHNLTATIGARYDYTLLPLPQVSNPTLDADLQRPALKNGGVTATFPEDRNNIGPRVSAAWSPSLSRGTPLFIMHLGYGAFYGQVPGATIQAALSDTALPSTTEHIRITPSVETQCPQVAQNQGFGYPCAFTTTPPAAVAQTTSATIFSARFRMPAVQRASLDLERSWGQFTVRAGYNMSIAVQLPQSVDLNLAPATAYASFVLQGGDGRAGVRNGETFALPVYSARLFSQYGPVTALVSHANATYHAGALEAQWREHGLLLRGRYVFSRSIDYEPQTGAIPRLNGQLDPLVNGYDKGLSTLNFPQRFTGELLYSAGLTKSLRIIRGLRVSAIGIAGSGAPYSYGIFGGMRLTGGQDSINGSGGAAYLPTVGRNTLRLPPRGRVDLRASKEFAAGVHVRMEAFAEAFNLLNARSLSRVETRAFLVGNPAAQGGPTPLIFQDAATVATEGISTPAFGTPTSSTAGLSRERQMQMGLRLRF